MRAALRARLADKPAPWYHEASAGGASEGASLHVAVHVRRGDVGPGHPSGRFVPISTWLDALQSLTDALAEAREREREHTRARLPSLPLSYHIFLAPSLWFTGAHSLKLSNSLSNAHALTLNFQTTSRSLLAPRVPR